MRPVSAVAMAALALGPLPVASQQSPDRDPGSGPRAEILVLGTYHMANPGRDVFNMDADDVLSPRRQAEIVELVDVLRRFRPTRIAVEAGFSDRALGEAYRQYASGSRELSRNEVEQIGFRLADQLGHETVYGVDVDGEFPFPRLADYATAHDRREEFEGLMAEVRGDVEAVQAYLASHTVLETLLYMNDEERAAAALAFDYRQTHFGEPWNWAGADLLAAWFHRNIRIHTNIVRLADSPGERVLVIFGAGHLAWLRHNVVSDPLLRLRTLADLVD